MLTPEVRAQLPVLYAQERSPNPIAYVKFFLPDYDWTFYASEFDGENVFFGLVQFQSEELTYLYLCQMLEMRGPMGLEVERDLSFLPTPIAELRHPKAKLPDDSQHQRRLRGFI